MSNRKNRLAKETSPYLLQHATNPIDWYPWGGEALDRARRDKKPIFLSIGYSACHWCHVMERESFQDPAVAAVLNEHFVSIKVDREERPEIDHLYMSAVQALTQKGGWPLNVFLTPDAKPFYGGTYFPPQSQEGVPAFSRLLQNIVTAWSSQSEELRKNAQALTLAVEYMQRPSDPESSAAHPVEQLVERAIEHLHSTFDLVHGGIGSAPKFFHTASLRFCLHHAKAVGDGDLLAKVTQTLTALSRGGIRDHLGGGFHRYSTDAQWRLPHFEKMLYDNALLAELFLEGFLATRRVEYAHVARETLDYVLREMTSDSGSFYSSQDADSQGVEGAFFTWTFDEVARALNDSDLSALFCQAYGVARDDTRRQVLFQAEPISSLSSRLNQEPAWVEDQLAVARRKLQGARNFRTLPLRDEKVLLNWNALMVHALALGHQVLGDERYLEAAQKAADFLWEHLVSPHPLPSGSVRFLRSFKDGKARFNAHLDDYAFALQALLSLYQSDFSTQWLDKARQVATSMQEQFWDASKGAFFFTGLDHEPLIARPRDHHDGATPSGTSIAISALLRLAQATDERGFEDIALAAIHCAAPEFYALPTAASQLAIAMRFSLHRPPTFLLSGQIESSAWQEALASLRRVFAPGAWIAVGPSDTHPPTLQVCYANQCDLPVQGTDAIRGVLKRWME